MRITKLVHSCLLIEEAGQAVLIDPGSFSWESGVAGHRALPSLNAIVITHDHADHYHPAFLEKAAKDNPTAVIITTEQLQAKIARLKLANTVRATGVADIVVFEAPHEPLPLQLPVPQNIGVHLFGRLTHPGDAWQLPQTREILALPMSAPWGSLKQALDAVVKLSPKIVLPVHDWHWHEAARRQMYQMSHRLLEPKRVRFMALQNGQPVEL